MRTNHLHRPYCDWIISLILRMVNLFDDICVTSSKCLDQVTLISTALGVNLRRYLPCRVAGMLRGMGGRFALESVAGIVRNMHFDEKKGQVLNRMKKVSFRRGWSE